MLSLLVGLVVVAGDATVPERSGVGLIAAHGGVFYAPAQFTTVRKLNGVFGIAASAGVRYAVGPGIGVVAVANGLLDVDGFQQLGLGAALRFGDRSHVSIGLMPTMFFRKTIDGFQQPSTLFATAVVQGALVIGEIFTLFVQPMIAFRAPTPMLTITAGVGVTL